MNPKPGDSKGRSTSNSIAHSPPSSRRSSTSSDSPRKSSTTSPERAASKSSASRNDDLMDLEAVLKYVHASKNADGTIDMDNYVTFYLELNKFFHMLGSIFSFVSKDVQAKIKILQEFRCSPNKQHYVTIQSMATYEKTHNLLWKSSPNALTNNGSRTLLRLHRALEFIKEFLGRVAMMTKDEKISHHAQETYNNTLAKYHPWLVQKAAIVAMYSLPYRTDLIRHTCKQGKKEADVLIPKIVEQMGVIYNITQNVYADNNLLDLP